MLANHRARPIAIVLHDQIEETVLLFFDANAHPTVGWRGFDCIAQQSADGDTHLSRIGVKMLIAIQLRNDQPYRAFLSVRLQRLGDLLN